MEDGGEESHDDDGGLDADDMMVLAAGSNNVGSSASRRPMQLEVVDVSSTSVSLSVIGPLEDSISPTPVIHHQHTRTASAPSDGPSSSSSSTAAIAIKLNSAAWPHVFHSDASFLDPEAGRSTSGDDTNPSNASSILVWGLSPGMDYHIELGLHEEPEEGEPGIVDQSVYLFTEAYM